MSAALKQLCVYLKFHDTLEQQRLINSDFMDIPPWVSYWLQSGVYPLIILAMVVFASIDMILYVGEPQFYNDAIGLRNMVGRVGDF